MRSHCKVLPTQDLLPSPQILSSWAFVGGCICGKEETFCHWRYGKFIRIISRLWFHEFARLPYQCQWIREWRFWFQESVIGTSKTGRWVQVSAKRAETINANTHRVWIFCEILFTRLVPRLRGNGSFHRIQGTEQGPVSMPPHPHSHTAYDFDLQQQSHGPWSMDPLLFSGSTKLPPLCVVASTADFVHCANDLERWAFFLRIGEKMSSLSFSRSAWNLLHAGIWQLSLVGWPLKRDLHFWLSF